MQRKRVLALLLAGMMFVSGADTALAADYASMDISAETDEEEQASEEASKETSVDPTDDPADDAGEGKGAPESDEEQEPSTDDESSEEASTEESGDEASLEISEDEALAAASAEKSVQHKEVEMYTGYVPEENLFPIVHNESGEILVRGEDDLPSSYATPLLPPLRNQSPYGTCWAFATTALEEINVMKQGFMSEPDLSELHLAYFTYNSVVDPLGLTEGDYVVTEDKENLLDLGGNFSEALDTQVKWTGAAAEETARYNRDDDLAKTTGLQDAIAYEDVVHIQDYYEEDIDFSGFRNTKNLSILDPIKRMVQKTGACGISFYVKNGKSPVTEGYTYSDEYNSYYNSQNTGDGHAVVIVGWDDDFPKEHFGEPAPGDGAFLIRNSWTTGNEESFSGYFWMSYYERTLWPRVYAVRCESADNYDNNYQYDGYLGKNYGIDGQTGANIYTAQNEPGATGEILQAVSFCGTGAGAGYTIEIYKKVVDRPDSGELYEEATTTGTVEFAGYNTVTLKKPVYLEPGEKFAVVVKVDTGSLCTEATFDHGYEGASSKAGESYEFNRASEWEDRGTQGCYRIKAFTDNREAGEYVAPTGIQFKNVSEDALEIGVGENFKITARVLPVSASVQDITWSSSAPEVVTVDKGTITGVSVGTAVVTASVSDGAIKKEVTVTVKKKLLGISIDRAYIIDTSAGERYYQFRASYVPSDYVPEGTLVWASSDEDVMTVDNSGKAKEHMMGNITITASVDGVTGKYAYRVYPSWDYFDYEVSNDRVITLKWNTAKNAEKYDLFRGPEGGSSQRIAQITHDGRESYEYSDTYYRDTDNESSSAVYFLAPRYEGDAYSYGHYFDVSIGTTYNITYHLDGGTQNPKNPVTYISGRAYNLYPPTPPAGYSFGGWYKDPEHQIYKNGISTTDTGDLDLYAYYYPQAPQLTVTPNEVVLSPGGSAVITAAYTPADGTEKYTFSSYDPMVAMVKENGNTATITGKEVGQTYIGVSCKGKSTAVHVIVSEAISFDENEITVKSGPGITRKLEVNMADRYSDKTVIWSSSDESIATVSNGIVDPADDLTEPAKVTITATLGDTGFYATCLVTVIPLVKVKMPKASVNGKAVNTEELLLSKGSYLSLASDTDGAKIFYALEGNEPSLDENGDPMEGTFAYDGAFCVEEGMKIKAFACKKGCETSDIASFDITIDENDWGDINDDYAINTFFEGMSSNVPSGVWYYFGNSEEGYAAQYYKGSGTIEFPEEYAATYYNGGKVTFNRDIHVFHGNRRLIEGRDYTVSYKNNSKAAYATIKSAPTVTVKGKGNYSSAAVFKFDIRRTSIDKAEITSETEIVVLTGSKTRLSGIKPTVKYAGKTLKEKKDYFLEYYDSLSSIVTNPSAVILNQPEETYSIVISAVGDIGSNFNGEMTKRINIKICSSKNIVSTSKLKAVNARGKAIKLAYDPERTDDDIISMFFNDEETSNPQAFVKYGKKTLVYGVDYIIRTIPEKDDYRSAGKHKFIIEGLDKMDEDLVSYIGDKTGTFEITGKPMSKVKIAGLKTSVEYTGQVITFSDLYNEKDKSVAAYNKYAEEDKKCAGVTLYRYDSATGKNLPLKGVEAGLESEDSDGNGVADGKECDYTYSKINSVYPGKFTMVFKGINGMTGSIKKTVTIKPYNVKNNVKGNLVAVLAGSEDVLYSKAGARPGVNVKFITARDIDGNELSSVALIEGIDYRVSYKNNTKVADKTAKKAPTVVIKGIGNYTGSSATLKFSVKKAAITSATLVASDVVYKAKGKKGYFLSVPKVYQDGKVLSVGKGKDIEGLNKKDLVYTYAGETTLLDANGTVRNVGEKVLSTDAVGPGTEIKVSIPASKLSCSAKSAFEHSAFEKEGDELVGTYRIVEGAKSISRYSASLKDPSKLAFNNANEVIIRESDIVIRKNKKTEPLAVSKYKVKSVSNSRFPGKTIIVIEGRDDYFGTKTISVKISAKKVNGK